MWQKRCCTLDGLQFEIKLLGEKKQHTHVRTHMHMRGLIYKMIQHNPLTLTYFI